MTCPTSTKILLVEDDEMDVTQFQRLACRNECPTQIEVVGTGEEALDWLHRNQQTHASDNVIVVTDLNMPGISGHELIEDIRKDQTLEHCIVFVFSTSDMKTDIDRAYRNGVAGYLVKDASGKRVEDGVKMLGYYCRAVSVPT